MTSTRSSRRRNRKRKTIIKIMLVFLLFVTTFISSYLITSLKLISQQKNEEKVKIVTPRINSQVPKIIKYK